MYCCILAGTRISICVKVKIIPLHVRYTTILLEGKNECLYLFINHETKMDLLETFTCNKEDISPAFILSGQLHVMHVIHDRHTYTLSVDTMYPQELYIYNYI